MKKKKEVLALLSNTNDSTLIEEVYDMLHSADSIDELNIQQLPKPLQEKVNKAIDDYKNGNYITHDEMKQKIATMAYQIIWTAEADNDFHSIIIYLKENWSDYTAEKFATKTINKLERIASKPYVPRFTAQPNVQMIKLDRKNVLFFTIENDGMILLSIYPYKKDITKSKYY